jgi:tetratricopeptide (TPR) repeat protein
LGPDDHEYHYNLGSALRELAEQTGSADAVRRAIDSYRRVTELRPSFWQGFYFLGRAQQLVPDDSAAIESFERGLALPDHARGEDLRTALARSLWRVGRRREAVAHLTTLLSEIPESEEAQLVWHETVEQLDDEQQKQQYEQQREQALRK